MNSPSKIQNIVKSTKYNESTIFSNLFVNLDEIIEYLLYTYLLLIFIWERENTEECYKTKRPFPTHGFTWVVDRKSQCQYLIIHGMNMCRRPISVCFITEVLRNKKHYFHYEYTQKVTITIRSTYSVNLMSTSRLPRPLNRSSCFWCSRRTAPRLKKSVTCLDSNTWHYEIPNSYTVMN